MTPSSLFILSLIIAGILLVLIILLMIKTYEMLSTQQCNYKNSFVPLSVQLVKRRQMIEKLIHEMRTAPPANTNSALLEQLERACSVAASAQLRANESNSKSHVTRRLARVEDAMIYSYCRLMESLQGMDEPQTNEWIDRMQQVLTDSYERLESALDEFNRALDDFNKSRSTFPFVLVAGMMGFQRMDPMALKKVCR
jgi:LemA protein